MARWMRALAVLPFQAGRVLDLGCAFGFATRMLERRGYDAVGIDSSPDFIAHARRASPLGTYLLADAAHVPFPDVDFDGVLLLDVLEHVADEDGVVREIARLLKPGGTLIISVPHRGLLAPFDSLNLYAAVVRATHHGIFLPEIAATGVHRHYSVAQIQALLGDAFEVRRVTRTGLGLAELVNLPLLLLFRWLLPLDALYQIVAFVYYTAYLVEDFLPLGLLGYHLQVVATRRPSHS